MVGSSAKDEDVYKRQTYTLYIHYVYIISESTRKIKECNNGRIVHLLWTRDMTQFGNNVPDFQSHSSLNQTIANK